MDWLLTYFAFTLIAMLMGSLWNETIGICNDYDSEGYKTFKTVGFGLLVGLLMFIAITLIVNATAEIEYKADTIKSVNKITVYDGTNNDTFYVWREDINNGGYYVSIRNGNISEKINISIEKLKVVPPYEPAQYVKYEPVFKSENMRKAIPMWRSSFNEVQVPDKYIKIRPGF